MKNRFVGFFLWLIVSIFVLVGGFGLNLTKIHADQAEDLPTVQFATTILNGTEKNSHPLIDVTLSGVVATDVMINYQVDLINSTAVNGVDYILAPGPLTILSGTQTSQLPLEIMDDKIFSGDKILVLEIFTVSANAVLNPDLDKLKLTYTVIDDNTPTTLLTKDPSAAWGQNGWFPVDPEITLSVDRTATTYYQWDTTLDDKWTIYADAFLAEEGDHTLYYYSETTSSGDPVVVFKETWKSETFKVDTIKPLSPIVSAVVDVSGTIHLAWNMDGDVSQYQIWRQGEKIATISAGISSYIDQNLTQGQTYEYQLLAFDQAGNCIESAKTSILVVKAIVTETAQENITVPVVKVSRIKPTIASGMNTTTKREVQSASEVVSPKSLEVNQPSNTEPETTQNWNKLLLAISILIIVSGVLIGSYYGYEWYVSRKDSSSNDEITKNKSRW